MFVHQFLRGNKISKVMVVAPMLPQMKIFFILILIFHLIAIVEIRRDHGRHG